MQPTHTGDPIAAKKMPKRLQHQKEKHKQPTTGEKSTTNNNKHSSGKMTAAKKAIHC